MTNLLFDFDGTLHNTIRIYAPAFRKAYAYLADKGLAVFREWPDKQISRWLGYSSKDMWNSFRPQLPDEEKNYCSQMIGLEMLAALKAGRGQLYDGAADTLRELKDEGYRLIFLSNCKIDYMQESIRQFSLDRFFTAFYCTEQYGFAPKLEIFCDITKEYDGDFIVIGDREIDIQIAERYSLPSIGCGYGYGDSDELDKATIRVDTPRDILRAVNRLSSKH